MEVVKHHAKETVHWRTEAPEVECQEAEHIPRRRVRLPLISGDEPLHGIGARAEKTAREERLELHLHDRRALPRPCRCRDAITIAAGGEEMEGGYEGGATREEEGEGESTKANEPSFPSRFPFILQATCGGAPVRNRSREIDHRMGGHVSPDASACPGT